MKRSGPPRARGALPPTPGFTPPVEEHENPVPALEGQLREGPALRSGPNNAGSVP